MSNHRTEGETASYKYELVSKLSGPKKQARTSTIVIIAFFSVLFSRMLDTLGAPSPINFLHFATVPAAFFIALTGTKVKSREQINTIFLLVSLSLVFLCCIIISSILNDAGIINGILSFLLWGEPFLFLTAILCLPTQEKILRRLRKCVTYPLIFHTFLAFVQHYVLKLHRLSGAQDNIQGIFYRSGAGHVVGASVALTFGIYFFVTAKKISIQIRFFFLVATFWQMLLADAKQVLLSLIVGGILLLATKLKDPLEATKYVLGSLLLGIILLWCTQNLSAFSAFNTWIRPEIYGADGEATLLKTAAFRIVPNFYESPLNWLFGLGPGHSVDRLGGWMFREYWDLLGPLGATTHPVSKTIWETISVSWLGNQSSMFSPMFGWAAIWGDLGLVGLMTYIGLGVAVLQRVCIDDLSKIMLFSVVAVGLVFSQMQEPGYMLIIAMLIGLNWHESRIRYTRKRRVIRR